MNMLGNKQVPQIGRAGGGIASPLAITGCILWLDGSDATSLYTDAGVTNVTADGQAVYRWADKSASANHANQSGATFRPLYKTGIQNSKSVIRFDGSNDDTVLTANVSDTTFTIFAVAQKTGGTSYTTILQLREGALLSRLGTDVWGTFTHYDTPYTGALSTTFKVLTVVSRAYNDIDLVENGSLVNTTFGLSYPARGTSAVGGSGTQTQVHVGDIAEIILYDSPLSTIDRESVESYLTSKWGL